MLGLGHIEGILLLESKILYGKVIPIHRTNRLQYSLRPQSDVRCEYSQQVCMKAHESWRNLWSWAFIQTYYSNDRISRLIWVYLNMVWSSNIITKSITSIQKPSQQVSHSQDEDMFTIPCSQNPTQSRFSSQRSIMARTQSILAIQRQPKNYYENVLIKCGVGLESMECYVLSKIENQIFWNFLFFYWTENRFSMQSLELCNQS